MSINEYRTAELTATEAEGDEEATVEEEAVDPNENTPAETVLPEEPEVEEVEEPEPEPKVDPNENLPAETVEEGAVPWGTPDYVPDRSDPNDGLPAETWPDGAGAETPPEDGEEETDDSDAEFEAERDAATAEVPTAASNKETIRQYLIYEHGIDPDDLQDQTKAELLQLVDDLAE